MQDKILLGLLMDHDALTTYDAKKLMEISTNLFYTTSLGSINPAFKKLEKESAVKTIEKIENGRLKKYYSITKKGKAIFQDWMDEEINISKVKLDILLKFFFFEKIPTKQKKSLLNNYLIKIKEHLGKMDEVNKFCIDNNLTGSSQHDTLRFGMDHYKFLYKWFDKYKKNLDK